MAVREARPMPCYTSRLMDNRREVVTQIVKSLNHHMDGNARGKIPGLTEEERLKNALQDMKDRGVIDFTQDEMLAALTTAVYAHDKMLQDPTIANQVVLSVIDLWTNLEEGGE